MTRQGLVIGAGGVTGLAWSSATLAALARTADWDPRDADVLVGTSQGSLLAGLLASGVGTEELVRWYRKELPDAHPLLARPAPRIRDDGRRGKRRPASPALLARAIGPGRISPVAALSGLLPVGVGSLDGFLAPLAALVGTDGWVEHDATWVTALDYDTGRRVCFGAPGQPRPPVLEAVRASCTVPGQFPPVRIDGRRYIDGGAHSTTNADLAVDARIDEVVVLAPMAGDGGVLQRVARRQLTAESRRLTAAGVTVRVLTPTRADRALMAAHPRDPAQRFRIFEAALESGPGRVAAAYR
ncbi:patatin-like phospholipase family protein [Nocardioides bizhenqiangii]|uniref:Patatin-like phospholipase family protein n=1 Tax=Nocardioides bizhenqiangii TaxID=3095076 RepID=A0ABZ0ZJE2_9ACTN|nr:patatin-like phospholipase family protein [Nocardioides sp. HM61]WQQ24498.1 patatin-like phospholipase family protein [Nocardioides sp. HM61]